MRVLGIDSSLTATGLARIDVKQVWDEGLGHWAFDAETAVVGAPRPTKDKSKLAMARRVNALIAQIEGCFNEPGECPDHVGLEALAYGARGEGAWVLPWIFGRVIELCEKYGVPLTVVATSARAKFATGKGNASKDTVLLTAAKLFPQIAFQDNNAADAMIVGAVVCQQLGSAILPVTQYRIEVIEKLGD